MKQIKIWTSVFDYNPVKICFGDAGWVQAREEKISTKERRFFEDSLSHLCFEHQILSQDPSHSTNKFLQEFVAKNNYKQKELYAGSRKWNFEISPGKRQCMIHEFLFNRKLQSVTFDHSYTQSMVLTSVANRLFLEPISFEEFHRIFSDKPKRVSLVPTDFNNKVRKFQNNLKEKFFEIDEFDIYSPSGELVINIYDPIQWKSLQERLSSAGITPDQAAENVEHNLGLETGNFKTFPKGKRAEVIAYIRSRLLG